MTIIDDIRQLREDMEKVFALDTKYPGSPKEPMSAGHCAIAAIAAAFVFGNEVEIRSVKIGGISHWFNRMNCKCGDKFDFDLTADQFGFDKWLKAPIDKLYSGSEKREATKLSHETQTRLILFLNRLGQERGKRYDTV